MTSRMDAIFKALNDPGRRLLLDSLRQRDGQTLTELEAHLAMTRFGVMKHLKVLEAANLIVSRKAGRFRHHYLNTLPLQEILDRWIEPMLARPAARALIDLKNQLEGTVTMARPDFMMQTYIRCSQDALWDALTRPDAMPHYHFMATRIERQGNRTAYFMPDGRELLANTDIRLDPKTRIEATFEPKWAGPGMAASRFVYLIEAQGALCKLTLEHYDLPADQGSSVADGWARMLSGLKTWLETGTDARFGSAGAARGAAA